MVKHKQNRSKDLTLIESETKEKIIIPQKGSRETEKRLGVWTNCDSTWHKEYTNWFNCPDPLDRK